MCKGMFSSMPIAYMPLSRENLETSLCSNKVSLNTLWDNKNVMFLQPLKVTCREAWNTKGVYDILEKGKQFKKILYAIKY